MKKSTKQKIVVLFIIVIFGMSSIAFFFIGVTSSFGDQEDVQDNSISSPVVEYEISPSVESLYIQNGITFLRYYYTEPDAIYGYVGTLPDTMTTLDGKIQLVVERISGDSRSLSIQSLYGGTEDMEDISAEAIFSALCNHLVSTPPECALKSINSTL